MTCPSCGTGNLTGEGACIRCGWTPTGSNPRAVKMVRNMIGNEEPMTDQLPLSCAEGNKRPAKTEEMRRQAAAAVVNEMVKYRIVDESDVAVSIEDIVKATRYHTIDGYKIARELERSSCWDCDMEMAERLESFSGILDDIYSAAERQWASENPNEPKFSDGDAVVWHGKPATIHGVYEHGPQYYKVKQGDMGSDTSYFVVPFEDVSSPKGTEID